jgi:hypothetical protein
LRTDRASGACVPLPPPHLETSWPWLDTSGSCPIQRFTIWFHPAPRCARTRRGQCRRR